MTVAALLAAFGLAPAEPDSRRAELVRDTRETQIAVAVDLDRAEPRRIDTGLPFFDHMLDQVAAHGGFSLLVECKGDLEVDAHHSVEDCAIAAVNDGEGNRGVRSYALDPENAARLWDASLGMLV